MLDVMIDLETLGSVPGCAILSIGAVPFSADGVGDEAFDVVIQRASCRAAGLHECPETLRWWDRQSAEARQIITAAEGAAAVPVGVALADLNGWLWQFGSNVRIWGNGADFDNAILAAAYRATGQRPFWKFWNGRCYRTLKGMFPHVKLARTGTHHRAIDDARSQAEHAVRLLAN